MDLDNLLKFSVSKYNKVIGLALKKSHIKPLQEKKRIKTKTIEKHQAIGLVEMF